MKIDAARARRSTSSGCTITPIDPYVKLAQREGFRARAAYKLSEIDEQFKLLEPGQLVVDLGADAGRLEPVHPPQVRRGAGATGGAAGDAQRHASSRSTCSRWSPSRASTSSRATSASDAVLAQLEARPSPATGRRRPLGHGAQPVRHRRVGRGTHGRSGRAGGRFRAPPPAPAMAPSSARSFTAAATVSWSSCSRPTSAPSSRSSRRRRGTSRPKPFSSASVSRRCRRASICPQ